MKPALQLRISQQLALTPQLQQAIRLLQLSSTELETELREALESNPMLELAEEVEQQTHGESTSANDYESSAPQENPEVQTLEGIDGFSDEVMDFNLDRNDYSSSASSDDTDGLEAQDEKSEDLLDHLLWQINLIPLSPQDRAIAVTIIEAIDDDGYLHESNDAIQQSLAPLYAVTVEEIEAIRHLIQHFDPLGVGSRKLSECLRVQLDAFDPSTEGFALARVLIIHHLEALAHNDRSKLCRTLHVSSDEFDAAIHLIRSLDPKPGAQVNPSKTEFVSPDAYVHKVNGRWVATLSANCQPKLSINQHYASLMAQAQRDDATYMRGQLQEARWLIKSLQTRAETLLKVASAIVRAQSAFLEYGPEAMRPLVLKDIAEEIGMHESTVSRVTTRKYLHTPRGTFEFKYFFASGVSTVDGGTASSTAIQAMIKKLIDEEKPELPYSDQALAAELNRRGISVARRTVAKYREALHIPSSNERGRLS